MKLTLAVLLMLVTVQNGSVPVLTREQKFQVQTITQRLEIAQLKMQAAQRDFEAARQELQVLLKAFDKDGYTLDLATLMYVKKADEKK